jgi:hypothetical protein
MSREVEFRDGKRDIPDHLADMMIELPTHTLTYEQAVEKANWKLANDHINRAYDGIVQAHFRNQGGS